MRELRILSFTAKGYALACRLGETLPARAERCNEPLSLGDWTARAFQEADGLIYVGAAGIAVRAIAPHLVGKTTDPAVVVVDELGHFAIPILSGHLGGGNALAAEIAERLGGTAVLTTATDVNGLFSVDDWAREQGLYVCNPAQIKVVAQKLLDGGPITVKSDWPISGNPPRGVTLTDSFPCDVAITLRPTQGEALNLIPRALTLGIGCKRGVSAAQLQEAFETITARAGIPARSVSQVSSIRLKAEEPGILAFCGGYRLPFVTFTAQELEQVPGRFSGSAFVRSVTGVDNVCERSAVRASGGELIVSKMTFPGIAMALALGPVRLKWRRWG